VKEGGRFPFQVFAPDRWRYLDLLAFLLRGLPFFRLEGLFSLVDERDATGSRSTGQLLIGRLIRAVVDWGGNGAFGGCGGREREEPEADHRRSHCMSGRHSNHPMHGSIVPPG
jgi:hypothetical protein